MANSTDEAETRKIVLEDLVELLAQDGAQNQYRQLDTCSAQLPALVECRYAEHVDSAFGRLLRDPHRAVTIGVGLDDEKDTHSVRHEFADPPDIPSRASRSTSTHDGNLSIRSFLPVRSCSELPCI